MHGRSQASIIALILMVGTIPEPVEGATAPVSQIIQCEDFSAKQGGTFNAPLDKEPRTLVKNMAGGNWLRYDSISFLDGEYDSIKLVFRSDWPQDAGGAIVRVRTGSATGPVVATFPGLWVTHGYTFSPGVLSAPASRLTGPQMLYLTFEGGTSICDVDKIILSGTMTVPPTPTAYYVATDGSDQLSGTSLTTPFRTIQRAARVMKAGDRCYIRQGVYRETVKPLYTGVAGAPLTFQPWNGETVYISGADSVKGWSAHTGSIYKAQMPWTLGRYRDQVIIDGTMAWVARSPNVDEAYSPHPYLNWCGTGVYDMQKWQDSAEPVAVPTVVCVNGPNGGVPDNFDMTVKEWGDPQHMLPAALFGRPSDFYKGGLVTARNWYWAMIGEIQSSHCPDGTTTVFTASPIGSTWNTNGGPGFISYVMGLLDAPNEWYRDTASQTLYLWAPGGGNPSQHLVEAKRRLLGMDLRSKQYVNVTGINFIATSLSLGDAQQCVIDDCHFKYVSHYDEFEWYDVAAAGFWHSPFDPSTGYTGIWISGDHNTFKNSSVVGSAGSGVILGGSYNTVTNCRIHSCDYAVTYQAGVLIFDRDPYDDRTGRGLTVNHNTIAYCSRANVQVTSAKPPATDAERLHIQYNDFGPACYTTKETGQVSVSGSVNGEISNNYFHGVAGNSMNAIVTEYDMGGAHWIVHHNVFWQGEAIVQGGFRLYSHWTFDWNDTGSNANLPNVGGAMCFNNTVVDYGISPDFTWDVDWPGYMRNNIMAASDTAPWKFSDPDNLNYTLRDGSPAIDAGIIIPGWVESYQGGAPDLGAYERGEPRWVAGADWQMPTLDYPPQPVSSVTLLHGRSDRLVVPMAMRVVAGRLLVYGGSPRARIDLFDARGAKVQTMPTVAKGPRSIITGGLATGIYLLRAVDGKQTRAWRLNLR